MMKENKYYDGKECHICHNTKRLISTNRCTHCMKEWIRVSNLHKQERQNNIGQPCSICKLPMQKPHWDHNSETGQFRGWLCRDCNLLIGWAREKIEVLKAAINYLK